MGKRWNGEEVEWDRGGMGRGGMGKRCNGVEVEWGRGGMGKRWNGKEMEWERGGMGKKWSGKEVEWVIFGLETRPFSITQSPFSSRFHWHTTAAAFTLHPA
ncbi:hypothetical protein Pcinc_034531 [Petrolisthes cinctipes]|uniref:Uncharacterized protein n=1 Tax=Petrolisthes cinctipes TaxID=88211 RepID=A0AAE1EQ32_PETCI|nr:hypothetical protein Pcinc_034531 [Petrolisthes cinctipes]